MMYYGVYHFKAAFYDSDFVFLIDNEQVYMLNDMKIIFGVLVYFDTNYN